ncbi:hypothetical protein QRD02_09005 [Aequorivita sp. SDUM287046]|uniref:Outer membrane protein beta-barrel domain-containing protein n=1 Tax=Aequorivita aurantiaca TaxID=3053356 RepID=A0ABT8DMY9_9FLAO|nr:hypothetical protein [Aequorivita aurantiaca]MDN3724520.1 hypothetical protein [Aequorivita aurantiaca]
MKLNFFLVFSLLYVQFQSYSQENETISKLTYHSFSISPIGFYTAEETVGPSFSADVRFSYMKNIFAFGAEGGTDELIYPGSKNHNSYYEFNLYYGRELKVYKRLYIDVFAGVGYVNIRQVGDSYEPIDDVYSTIGVPVTGTVKLVLNRGFIVGVKFHANLNSERIIFSAGPHLQFTAKSRRQYE